MFSVLSLAGLMAGRGEGTALPWGCHWLYSQGDLHNLERVQAVVSKGISLLDKLIARTEPQM